MKCCKSIRLLVIVLAILAAKLTLLLLIPLLDDLGFVVAVAIAQDGSDDEVAGDRARKWGAGIPQNLLSISFANEAGLLAEHNWNLAATAAALKTTLNELVKRLEKAGFGYLINQQVREQVTKRMKS